MTRIEQIKARLEAATPGPWGYDLNGHIITIEDDGECGDTVLVLAGIGPGCVRGKDADAELAAHAPDDIAALILVAEAAERWYDISTNDEPPSFKDYMSYRESLAGIGAAIRVFREGWGAG